MLGKKDSTKRFGGSYYINVVIAIAFVARARDGGIHRVVLYKAVIIVSPEDTDGDECLNAIYVAYVAHCIYDMPKTQLLFIFFYISIYFVFLFLLFY